MSENVRLRLIRPEDSDRVLEFLREHYYPEEPLTVGSQPQQQDHADEQFTVSNIAHGTCVMAVQTDATSGTGREIIVGAVMAGPKDSHESEHLFEEAARCGSTKWGKILKFLASVERDADVCNKFGVSKALHAHVLAVNKQLRGKSLGQQLLQELVRVGKTNGYALLTMDCTSVYSARLCARLAMECVNTLNYDMYRDSEGVQVFCPPTLHECVKTYAIRL